MQESTEKFAEAGEPDLVQVCTRSNVTPTNLVHIPKRCGQNRDKWTSVCGERGRSLLPLKPKTCVTGKVFTTDPTVPNCPACFAIRAAKIKRKAVSIQ
jgi:hypothetical protein